MTGARRVFGRELAVVVGSPALPVAMAAQVVVLMVFLLVWGGGVPTMQGATVLEQLLAVQWGALVLVMPWAAARSVATGGREGMRLLSLLTGVPSRQIMWARLTAVFVALACVGLGGLPFVVVAQQIAAAPTGEVARSLAAVLALAALVTPVVTRWGLESGERLTIWIGATMTTAVVAWLVVRLLPGAAPWVLVGLGVAAAALLAKTGHPRPRTAVVRP